MPRFSVVLPTYNRAGTLPRAVSSVLTQTMGDLELIVIDDGSTDGTADGLTTLDPREPYSSRESGGIICTKRGPSRIERGIDRIHRFRR